MEINPNQLPSDPAALRQMVVGLLGEAVERERKLRQLQHWVEQLLRARYGPRRERVDENGVAWVTASPNWSRPCAPRSST